MKKAARTFNVSVTAFATVMVVAQSEEEAMKLATEEIRFGDFQHDTTEVKGEAKTPEEIASLRRHADKIVEDI